MWRQDIIQACDKLGVPALGPDGRGRVRTIVPDPG
jgi:hypothetical protein